MLSWVVALDEGGQHPCPARTGHLQSLSCIAQHHPHPAQPTAPSQLQELIPVSSCSSGKLSLLVPSPSSLLGNTCFLHTVWLSCRYGNHPYPHSRI